MPVPPSRSSPPTAPRHRAVPVACQHLPAACQHCASSVPQATRASRAERKLTYPQIRNKNMLLDGVEDRFVQQWHQIQSVFDTAPIPQYIEELLNDCIFTEPKQPPKTNPPLAFGQHAVLAPGDEGKIVAERADCTKHIVSALRKEFPQSNQEELESPDLIAAIDFVASHYDKPASLVKHRSSLLAKIRVMKQHLIHHNAQLQLFMPSHVAKLSKAVPIDICIVYILNAISGGSDHYMAHCFVTGFPLRGRLHKTGWYRPGRHKQTDFTDDHAEWNIKLIRSIRRRAMKFKTDADRKGLEECYKATLKECEMGLMDGPYTYKGISDELKGHNICALRRFPQYRYPGAPVRPCDNGAENNENERYDCDEKLLTENSDFPLRSATMYRRRMPKSMAFRLSSNDLKKAYRQMPSGHPGSTVVALWNPDAKQVEFFLVMGMPFGLATSVLQFNRPMESLVAVLRRLFGVSAAHYYDDIINASPAFAAKSDDDTTIALCALTGYVLDGDKHVKHDKTNPFLGVIYDFSHYRKGVVLVRIKPERKDKIRHMINAIFEQRKLTAGGASSLRGKLFFSCTQAFGRAGRAALQPFVQRQYSAETELTPSIVSALEFFTNFLDHADAIPRTCYIDPPSRSHLLIWTDAAWERMMGTMGIVIFVPEAGRFYYSFAEVPDWMVRKWVPSMQKIGQAEILAAILPYISLPPKLLNRRNVIHFVDNTSALSALLNGYSRASDSAWMVNIFHTHNTKTHTNVWWEHVDSKANCSDMPSRRDFDFVINTLHATYFHTVLDEYAWNRPAYQWFH